MSPPPPGALIVGGPCCQHVVRGISSALDRTLAEDKEGEDCCPWWPGPAHSIVEESRGQASWPLIGALTPLHLAVPLLLFL